MGSRVSSAQDRFDIVRKRHILRIYAAETTASGPRWVEQNSLARWKGARAWDRSRDRESEDQKQDIQTNFFA